MTPRDLASEMANRARDAAYTVVGLGVLGVQRAQVHRHDLERTLTTDDRLAGLRSTVAVGVRQLDELVERATQIADKAFEPLEAQLPPPAKALADSARSASKELRAHVRQLVEPWE